ncbi:MULTISPECIES: menaquinone-dependent protoporphyrinogen IX dehydrogenase [Yersinia]|uniref:Protoporphyrinogen IX dehydrogenase [quinone] n=2 Tax=Yersinia bercovieri TaxID=634 RepID=A0A2G4U397_YERBE|nr:MULTISPECIES: menaquinone-dependent protoporphyrinogen IX dehydrogenase [Yersinia]EEQ06664.1 Protoporphyrinogen oxidase (PPO) [Yersinia bercovieri ATCC 43970]MBS0056156.1 menaquinone-dependent protoporphyrinogen IX dehydrogenase [Yersinia sp. Marseille-Q3913]MCB5304304.1 menaquinone-dependent protoporphyrinogen IX dehydrogenase [Yersinia bercovieri]MDN0104242.1 menaquinone-dependent protoporphyrinogen IX dehydrogenase [Yersinia bercovieri]PHZ27256.1 menaquinone-dependent protoporphyrinogen 
MNILILFSSRDGQTHAIASYIAKQLSATATCEIQDLSQVGQIDLNQYQQVMIGASVRYGHFSPVLSKFVSKHVEQLNQMPSAFFAVNLTARKPEKRSPQTNAYVRKFLLSTPWQPTLCTVFAGALRYPRYRWIDRVMIQLIMRMTGGETDTSKEVEYTDWQQVSSFTQDFSALQYEK